MPMEHTRRAFLQSSSLAGASLLIGFRLSRKSSLLGDAIPSADSAAFSPNAWLEIAPDGNVTIWCGHSEMGQGVWTSLPLIVAEELGCNWRNVRVKQADLDPKYGDQLTGGSLSVRTSYSNLRKAGAAARLILVDAAATGWNVSPAACTVENGRVVHAESQRSAGFGELLKRAAALPPPSDPPLKAANWIGAGGQTAKRKDTPLKVTGEAKFGMDVRVPSMLIASVERCPVFGGKVKNFDPGKVQGLPGVRKVVEVRSVPLTHQFGETVGPSSRNLTRSGVAIVADSTWAAMLARKSLQVEWDLGSGASESTAGLHEQMSKLAGAPGFVLRNDGDFDAAWVSAASKLEAVYEVPFLAHATMEPMNCTAHVHDDGCELWAPTQIPGAAAEVIAKALNISREKMRVHITFLGGGFGRRLIQDYAVEAALISRDVGAPVQVVWTREDDIQHDYYRPAAVHALRAGLDSHGNLVAWRHRASSPSIGVFYEGTQISPAAASELNGPDFPAFGVPNFRVEFARLDCGVPVGYWRSVENSGNQFVISSFLDEAAAAAKRDPVEFHLALLGAPRKIELGHDSFIDVGRRRGVIELVAEKSGWTKALQSGVGRGIATQFGYGRYVAQVVEASYESSTKKIRIHRTVCAIDCGLAVHPDGVRAQMESAIHFGLAAALKSAITVKNGRIEQSNFHDYEVLRLPDAPEKIEVHIVQSNNPPGGCGEPGVPPIAPALCNALFAATGKRIRRLPISSSGFLQS